MTNAAPRDVLDEIAVDLDALVTERAKENAAPRDVLDDIAVDLDALVTERAGEYAAANPFPHAGFDGVFSDHLLKQVAFECATGDMWVNAKLPDKSPNKRMAMHYEQLGPYTKHLFNLLTSSPFVDFVQRVTGIPCLIPDPHLHAGGVHDYTGGGHLELHTDYNFSPHLRLYRRINLLLYLHPGWETEWGGELQLWDTEFTQSVSYAPLFNRLVLAHVLPDGLHGVGEIHCPPDHSRKCVALWYYTSQLPLDIQTGYDMCEPDFINRKGDTPIPLPRPLWRKILPPILIARLKKRRQCFTYSPHQVKAAITRFVPPILMKAVYRLTGGSQRG